MTIDDLSDYTGLSKTFIYKLTSSLKIPFYKPTGKCIYFKRSELDSWLLRNRHMSYDEIELKADECISRSRKI